MNGWDQLIARLTQPLEVDEELRLDVARELRCHLEDSAAQFRAAGESPSEAAASAVKALGNEQELTEQLWQANRGRIRLRGVLRWTARVTLLPAAAAVVLVLFTYLAGVISFYTDRAARIWGVDAPRWPMGPLGRLVCDPYLGVHLTEDQRWLLFGDPNAKDRVEKAKSIYDRWPENPVFYANYVTYVMSHGWGVRRMTEGDKATIVDKERFAEVLGALRQGEQVDPNNGMYNVVIASMLIDTSTITREDPCSTYDQFSERSQDRPTPVMQVEIVDANRFKEGVEEFRKGLAKPLLTGRTLEMHRLRLAALPPPVRLIQYLERMRMLACVQIFPLQWLRATSESLLAYARELAHQGHSDEAEQLLRDVAHAGARLGAQGDMLVELLVGQAVHYKALAYQEVTDREHGRANLAEQARQMRKAEYDLLHRILAGRSSFNDREKERRLGFLEGMTGAGGLPGSTIELTPVRAAELFVFLEVGLLGLLAFLLLVAVGSGAGALLGLVFAPRAERPVLLFIGWGRLGRILLLAVVVPLAAYAAYVAITGLCMGEAGLTMGNLGRVIVELSAVGVVVLGSVVRLSRSAIRQRAGELGLTVPAARRWRDQPVMWGVTGAVAVAVLGYLVGWWAGPLRRGWTSVEGDHPGIAAGAGVWGLLVLWVVRPWVARLREARFHLRLRGSDGRAAVGLLAAAVAVVGVALASLLAERRPFDRGDWDVVIFAAVPALAIVVVGWFGSWVLWRMFPRATARPADRFLDRTIARSMVPILAAAVIVVGVALGGLLTVGEGYAISRMGNTVPFIDELTHSDWRLLQEHFAELDKAFQRQEASPADKAGR